MCMYAFVYVYRTGPLARHGQAIALYIDRLKPLWARLAVAEEERVAFLGAREGVRAACSYRCIAPAHFAPLARQMACATLCALA